MKQAKRTASFGKFKFDISGGVYEPAEDSFLLAEFSQDLEGDVLDVGAGCGIQAIACKGNAAGVDISAKAVENAKANAKNNKSKAKFFVSDMFSSVKGKFDAIVFNPPYLPTSPKERLAGEENYAYDGGESGREVLDKFLDEFEKHLKPKGKLLILLSSLSDKGETKRELEGRGFKVRELARKHVGLLEELFVIEAKK